MNDLLEFYFQLEFFGLEVFSKCLKEKPESMRSRQLMLNIASSVSTPGFDLW